MSEETQAPNPTQEPPAPPPPATRDFSEEKEMLTGMAAQLSIIASTIPTPGVTDSYVHSKTLSQCAARLKAMAESL